MTEHAQDDFGSNRITWDIQFFTDADIARARMLAKGAEAVPADPGWLERFAERLELAALWSPSEDGKVLWRAVSALPPSELLAGRIALALLYTDVMTVDAEPVWEEVLAALDELPLDGGETLPLR